MTPNDGSHRETREFAQTGHWAEGRRMASASARLFPIEHILGRDVAPRSVWCSHVAPVHS
jgi:hypothetical protein